MEFFEFRTVHVINIQGLELLYRIALREVRLKQVLARHVVDTDLLNAKCFGDCSCSLHCAHEWRALDDDFVELHVVLLKVFFEISSHKVGLLLAEVAEDWILFDFPLRVIAEFFHHANAFSVSNQSIKAFSLEVVVLRKVVFW